MSPNRPPGPTTILSILTTLLLIAGATGCSYTQLATTPGTYEPEPLYDDYVPEPARGAWGQLSTWGYWIEVPEFGWVWQPDVGYDWQPYFHGQWSWTSYGWTWMSYEPFGWITYHYGYWSFNPNYGWFWIPDDYWYPCGVTWVYYDDFVCWAPMPPPGHHLMDPWITHSDRIWMVCDVHHFYNPNIGNYKYRQFRPDPRYGSKKVFRTAPEKIYVERSLGTRIREVPVQFDRVRSGDREYQRVRFPDDQNRTIERYQSQRENVRDAKPSAPPERRRDEQPATKQKEAKPKGNGDARDARPSKGRDTSGSSKSKDNSGSKGGDSGSKKKGKGG